MRIQQRIKSNFNASSTVSDVLFGLNLSGKTVLITGGHSGLGFEATKALLDAGAHVVLAMRQPDQLDQSLLLQKNISVFPLDLSDLNSVRQLAAALIESQLFFDYVICNAGIMACPETRVGNNWESQFATNHVGHYVLINLLWNNIRANARIVSVSSTAHHLSPIQWDDIHFLKQYDKWLAYGQSKTANALFALQLDEYGKKRGIRAFSVHPGKIFTQLQRHLSNDDMAAIGWKDQHGNPIDPTFKTPAQGAATAVWAAVHPDLNGRGGLYCEDCNIAEPSQSFHEPLSGVCHYAADLNEAQKLWAFTANLTGINIFADH